MDTDFKELAIGIQEIKNNIPDIYTKPKIMLGYLFDWFPEREALLAELALCILSDISVLFDEQVHAGKFDSKKIVSNVIDNNKIKAENANHYLELLFEAEGIINHFEPYIPYDEKNDNRSEVQYKIDISKLNSSRSAEEYYQMACLQKTEKGIQNLDVYIEFLEKASEKGHLLAKHSMALLYLKGKYVSQDFEKGFSLLKECADYGDGNSNYEIYIFSKRYKDVISDSIAFDYLKKASAIGVTEAQYDLAMQYYENGIEEDYKKAFDLLSKCANKNDAGALYQLALCYRYGHGTALNLQKAMEMLKCAANLGHKKAKEIVGG